MAAKQHPSNAAGAAALGMIAPAAGMAALAALLGAHAPGAVAGVRGAAAASYWRLLLRGAPGGPPAMFAAVLDTPHTVGWAPEQYVCCCIYCHDHTSTSIFHFPFVRLFKCVYASCSSYKAIAELKLSPLTTRVLHAHTGPP